MLCDARGTGARGVMGKVNTTGDESGIILLWYAVYWLIGPSLLTSWRILLKLTTVPLVFSPHDLICSSCLYELFLGLSSFCLVWYPALTFSNERRPWSHPLLIGILRSTTMTKSLKKLTKEVPLHHNTFMNTKKQNAIRILEIRGSH